MSLLQRNTRPESPSHSSHSALPYEVPYGHTLTTAQLEKSLDSGYNLVVCNGAVREFLDPFEKPLCQLRLSHYREPPIEGYDPTMWDFRVKAEKKPVTEFLPFVADEVLELNRRTADKSHWTPASVWQTLALQKKELGKKYPRQSSQSNISQPPFIRTAPPSRKELYEYTASRKRLPSDKTGPLDTLDERGKRELANRFLGSEKITLVDASSVLQMEKGSLKGRPNLRFLSNNRHPDLKNRTDELFEANSGVEGDTLKSLAQWHIASEFYNKRHEAGNEWVSVSPAVFDHVLERCEEKATTEGAYTGVFDSAEALEELSRPSDTVYTKISDMEIWESP